MKKVFLILIPLLFIGIFSVFALSYRSDVIWVVSWWVEKEKIVVWYWESIVFSFPKRVKSIDFSQTTWFTLRTLEWWVWKDVQLSNSEFQPLKWYLLRNFSNKDLIIYATYDDVSVVENTIFQKTLYAWWNLIWVAHKDDVSWKVSSSSWLWDSLPYSHVLDFTWNGFNLWSLTKWIYSWEPSINNNINNNVSDNYNILPKSSVVSLWLNEKLAYWVFVNNDTMIAWSQNLTNVELDAYNSNNDDLIGDLLWNIDLWTYELSAFIIPLSDVNNIVWTHDITWLMFDLSLSWPQYITLDSFEIPIKVDWVNSSSWVINKISVYEWDWSTLLAEKILTWDSTWNILIENINKIVNPSANYNFVVKASLSDSIENINKIVNLWLFKVNYKKQNNSLDSEQFWTKWFYSPRDITITWPWDVFVTYDQWNEDNENNKNILAWTSEFVASVDVQAINESINVWQVIFTLTWAVNLKNSLTNASLYLDNVLIDTNSNAEITNDTIIFNNLTNLNITEATSELRLKLNTNPIWYQKLGIPDREIFITWVSLNNNSWVSWNQVTNKQLLFLSKSFDISPVVLTPSVFASLNSSTTPQIKITSNTGENTRDTSNSTPDTLIRAIRLSTIWSSVATLPLTYTLTNLADSSDTVVGTVSGNMVTFDLNNMLDWNKIISWGASETYRITITWTTEGDTVSLKLLTYGVSYDVLDNNLATWFSTHLDTELDLWTRVY